LEDVERSELFLSEDAYSDDLRNKGGGVLAIGDVHQDSEDLNNYQCRHAMPTSIYATPITKELLKKNDDAKTDLQLLQGKFRRRKKGEERWRSSRVKKNKKINKKLKDEEHKAYLYVSV
jgi:hypothetical protein